AVAVAILNGDHLEYTHPRQLAASPGKALSSAINLVARIAEKFSFTSAVLEIIPNGHEVQRTLLDRAIVRTLTEQSIDILRVAKPELFEAFAYPPLHSRKELREIASDMWPVLDVGPGGPWTHDAAVLGLYVQIERLFIIN